LARQASKNGAVRLAARRPAELERWTIGSLDAQPLPLRPRRLGSRAAVISRCRVNESRSRGREEVGVTAHGDKQLRLLTVVRSGQRVFHEVIERYLARITYEGGWAARLILPITEEPLIVADPERAFGQPIFIHGGARLADVRGRVGAGEDEAAVAEDYGVPLEDVRAAVAPPTSAAA
jgi:uncharacterized protein (DUF433 family)